MNPLLHTDSIVVLLTESKRRLLIYGYARYICGIFVPRDILKTITLSFIDDAFIFRIKSNDVFIFRSKSDNILSTNIILVEDKMKGLENRKNEMEELDYLRQMNELRQEQSLNLERCKWNIEENGNDNDDNDDNNISDDNEQENANMNIDD
eukprot:224515_1